jgi:hypothetical protein
LVEFLGVAYVAESDFVEGILCIGEVVLYRPFLMLVCMLLARVGTMPRTAYSASLTQGLT